jgi:hypothetical protein
MLLMTVFVGLAIASWTGCDEWGRYNLTWTFDDAAVHSAQQCAERGIALVRVTVYAAGSDEIVDQHTNQCFPTERLGPRLNRGTYDLKVEGLRFDGKVFRHPQNGDQFVLGWVENVRVRNGQWTAAAVDLGRAPRCMDGVDSDGDGRVDAMDPGCWKLNSKGEVTYDEHGDPIYVPLDDAETDPATGFPDR